MSRETENVLMLSAPEQSFSFDTHEETKSNLKKKDKTDIIESDSLRRIAATTPSVPPVSNSWRATGMETAPSPLLRISDAGSVQAPPASPSSSLPIIEKIKRKERAESTSSVSSSFSESFARVFPMKQGERIDLLYDSEGSDGFQSLRVGHEVDSREEESLKGFEDDRIGQAKGDQSTRETVSSSPPHPHTNEPPTEQTKHLESSPPFKPNKEIEEHVGSKSIDNSSASDRRKPSALIENTVQQEEMERKRVRGDAVSSTAASLLASHTKEQERTEEEEEEADEKDYLSSLVFSEPLEQSPLSPSQWSQLWVSGSAAYSLGSSFAPGSSSTSSPSLRQRSVLKRKGQIGNKDTKVHGEVKLSGNEDSEDDEKGKEELEEEQRQMDRETLLLPPVYSASHRELIDHVEKLQVRLKLSIDRVGSLRERKAVLSSSLNSTNVKLRSLSEALSTKTAECFAQEKTIKDLEKSNRALAIERNSLISHSSDVFLRQSTNLTSLEIRVRELERERDNLERERDSLLARNQTLETSQYDQLSLKMMERSLAELEANKEELETEIGKLREKEENGRLKELELTEAEKQSQDLQQRLILVKEKYFIAERKLEAKVRAWNAQTESLQRRTEIAEREWESSLAKLRERDVIVDKERTERLEMARKLREAELKILELQENLGVYRDGGGCDDELESLDDEQSLSFDLQKEEDDKRELEYAAVSLSSNIYPSNVSERRGKTDSLTKDGQSILDDNGSLSSSYDKRALVEKTKQRMRRQFAQLKRLWAQDSAEELRRVKEESHTRVKEAEDRAQVLARKLLSMSNESIALNAEALSSMHVEKGAGRAGGDDSQRETTFTESSFRLGEAVCRSHVYGETEGEVERGETVRRALLESLGTEMPPQGSVVSMISPLSTSLSSITSVSITRKELEEALLLSHQRHETAYRMWRQLTAMRLLVKIALHSERKRKFRSFFRWKCSIKDIQSELSIETAWKFNERSTSAGVIRAVWLNFWRKRQETAFFRWKMCCERAKWDESSQKMFHRLDQTTAALKLVTVMRRVQRSSIWQRFMRWQQVVFVTSDYQARILADKYTLQEEVLSLHHQLGIVKGEAWRWKRKALKRFVTLSEPAPVPPLSVSATSISSQSPDEPSQPLASTLPPTIETEAITSAEIATEGSQTVLLGEQPKKEANCEEVDTTLKL